MKPNMTERKRWLISSIIACLVTGLGSLAQENRPLTQKNSVSFDGEKSEWVVSGTYRFTRLEVNVFGLKLNGFCRIGEFSLRIPDDSNKGVSSTQYKDEAIAQARENAGKWTVNIFAVLFAITTCTVIIRFIWWFFQKGRNRTKPSNATSKSTPSAASKAVQG